MTLKKIIGTGAIAGALGFSAIGLSSVANAAPTPQAAPSVVQHAQLTGWGDHGWGGDHGRGGGRGWGGPGWRGPGWGGPGFAGWGGPPPLPPCSFGLCI
jgi:hypothetical protein